MKSEYWVSISISMAFLTFSTGALAERCDTILAKLQQERHLTLVKQTEGKQTTEYRDGLNTTLSLSCALGLPNIMVSWDGARPDQQFYELVGRAGSLVSRRSASDIAKFSEKCRTKALNDSGEIAKVELKGLAIECQAFDRDGGGTIISVFAG
ncbi:hypothetical protein ACOYXF_15485 [Pseudomonas sp. Tul1A2]